MYETCFLFLWPCCFVIHNGSMFEVCFGAKYTVGGIQSIHWGVSVYRTSGQVPMVTERCFTVCSSECVSHQLSLCVVIFCLRGLHYHPHTLVSGQVSGHSWLYHTQEQRRGWWGVQIKRDKIRNWLRDKQWGRMDRGDREGGEDRGTQARKEEIKARFCQQTAEIYVKHW